MTWVTQCRRNRSAATALRVSNAGDAYFSCRVGAPGCGCTRKAAKRHEMPCHHSLDAYLAEYLRNGGKLEIAQRMANHESARTTGLYDRRDDQVSLDEVERILISAGGG